jgi:hypothetical protein
MKTVALIACAASKRNYRCEAKLMYDKGKEFPWACEYAQLCSDEQFALSSKYGLLGMCDVIDTYDYKLKGTSAKIKKAWASKVYNQLSKLFDLNDTRFIMLAGKDYYQYLIGYLPHHSIPMEHLKQGERPPYLKQQIAELQKKR